MKKIIIISFLLLLLPYSLSAITPQKKQFLSPKKTLQVLEALKENSISFGHGKKEIHTFIDPFCELSQRYLSFIFKKKDRMFSKYTFYFYLYELDGKNSSNAITTIISSEYKQTSLKAVMLNKEDIEYEECMDANDIIDNITDAAKKIGVFKRPYIIINGKVK